MNDQRLREWYAEGLTARRGGTRTGCPGPADLQALLERQGPEEERLACLDHVMACPECLREFELLRTLRSAAPARRVAPRLMAIAAGLVLVASAAILWQATAGSPPASDTLRGQAVSFLVGPGDNARATFPVTFVWHSVDKARRYRFEIIDEGGEVVVEAETPDTVLRLERDPRLDVGAAYHWWVVASRTGGRQARSTPRRIAFEPQ